MSNGSNSSNISEGDRPALKSSSGSSGSSSSSGEEDGEEKRHKKNDGTKLEVLFQKSRFARVRTRFPVPVILWNNKNASHCYKGYYILKDI